MSYFSFVPLLPFFCAALAKRWKVQFRQGFAYFNNNVDSKRHIIIRTAILYNEINSGQIMKKHYIYMYIHSDTQDVLSDLRNTAYWIAINKSLNETAKSNFKNTLIQYNAYNVQNFRPHLRSSSVLRRQLVVLS